MSTFDQAADTYDIDFTNTSIGKSQRNRVWKYLQKIERFDDSLDILELNCGTGEDAVFFASKGHQVLATDISEKMLTEAKQKSQKSNLNIQFQNLDLRNPGIIENKKFDLIFSNFGGLNCLSNLELTRLNFFVKSHLKNKGSFIGVIMPKHTLMEGLYRKAKGQVDQYSNRKSDSPSWVNVNGVDVATYYFNSKDIIEYFPSLSIVKTLPIGYLPSYFEQSKFLFLFKWIEKLMFISKLNINKADHFLIHLKKKD